MKTKSLVLATMLVATTIVVALAKSGSDHSGHAGGSYCCWSSGDYQAEGTACGCGWCVSSHENYGSEAGCMFARLMDEADVKVTTTEKGVIIEVTSDNPDVVKHLQECWNSCVAKTSTKKPEQRTEGYTGCACYWCTP